MNTAEDKDIHWVHANSKEDTYIKVWRERVQELTHSSYYHVGEGWHLRMQYVLYHDFEKLNERNEQWKKRKPKSL